MAGRRLVVAGTHSGVGKTTVTLALMGALRRRGLTVQPYTVTITNSYGQSKTITVTTIGRVNIG